MKEEGYSSVPFGMPNECRLVDTLQRAAYRMTSSAYSEELSNHAALTEAPNMECSILFKLSSYWR
jgi:hypothetical protein